MSEWTHTANTKDTHRASAEHKTAEHQYFLCYLAFSFVHVKKPNEEVKQSTEEEVIKYEERKQEKKLLIFSLVNRVI